MKLWIVSSSYPRHPGESVNAGVLARDLALTFASSGHHVTVITPEKPGGVSFDVEVTGKTVRWWRPTLTLSDLSSKPGDVIRAGSLLASGVTSLTLEALTTRPQRMIALWGVPSGLLTRAVSATTGIPYSVWLLGSDVWDIDRFPLGRIALKAVIRSATDAFADGDALAKEAEAISGVEVRTLHSARRLPSRRPRPRHGALFIGRYHPNKGPDVLVSAAMTDAFKRAGISLTIRGTGDMEPRLRSMAGSSPTEMLSIGGPVGVEEVADLMSTHKVLVIPSRVDSIPLVLGDAISARIPVVATDVGDLGRIVERFGLGATVPSEAPEELAEKIIEVHESPPRGALWEEAAKLLSLDTAAATLIA